MGLFDFFKRKKENQKYAEEPLVGVSLDNLKKGDIIEIDGESWEVIGVGYYDYGGEIEKDWELLSSKGKAFLNKEDDSIYFFVKDNPNKVSPPLISYLKEHEDFPPEISFDGEKFSISFSGSAYYVKDNTKAPVIIWDFENKEGKIVEILQWGEEDFEVYVGRKLKEWEIEEIFHK